MDKKEEVIKTARELFTKYGYKKVSMDEIAKKSGVTKKTIYTYFKDKDSMFLYFIEEELNLMKDSIKTDVSDNMSFIESVAKSLYEMLLIRKNSELISSISKELKTDEKAREFLNFYDRQILNYIESRISDEINKGNIRVVDPHLTAFIIYKVFISVMFEYDKDINEEKVTKQVTLILKEGLFN